MHGVQVLQGLAVGTGGNDIRVYGKTTFDRLFSNGWS
jgi:hypothetical protein